MERQISQNKAIDRRAGDRRLAQRRDFEVISVMKMLMHDKCTVHQLSARFGISLRTAYRYLSMMEEMDIGLDQDFNRRYFIPNEACPLCNNQQPHE
jgi:DNA-binding IclR family transcriptional regulator